MNVSTTSSQSEIITAVGLGTTFTSPTGESFLNAKAVLLAKRTVFRLVYISFDSLYASDSCTKVGATYSDEIVAITNLAGLSSLWGWDEFNNGDQNTASFNLADLIPPVPNSIYNSQPRCASEFIQTYNVNPGIPMNLLNWTCPHTRPYEPILGIPMEVRQLDSAWATCMGGINGLYDPPSALQAQQTIAMPLAPPLLTTVSSTAEPASSLVPPSAPQTSTAPSQTDPPGSPSSLLGAQSTSESQLARSTEPAPDQSYSTGSGNLKSLTSDDNNGSSITYSAESPTSADPAVPQSAPEQASSLSYVSRSSITSLGDLAGETQSSAIPTVPVGSTNALSILSAAELSALSTLSMSADPTYTGLIEPSIVSSQDPATAPQPSRQSQQPGESGVLATVGQLTVGADPINSNAIVIGSQTLNSDQQATISNTVVSVGNTGALVLGGSTTVPLPVQTEKGGSLNGESASSPALYTIGADPSNTGAIIVAGKTLSAAGSAQMISGTQVSMATGGSLLIGSAFVAIPTLDPSSGSESTVLTIDFGGEAASTDSYVATDSVSASVSLPGAISGAALTEASITDDRYRVTIGSQLYTAVAGSSGLAILSDGDGTITLSSGGPAATIDGQRASAIPSGIVIGTGPFLSAIHLAPKPEASAQVITIGSQTFTYFPEASSSAEVFANGRNTITVMPGAAATSIGTQIVSAGLDGALVVGGRTIQIITASGGAAGQSEVITVGTRVLTEMFEFSNAEVFAGRQTTITLSPDGSAAIVDGQSVSAASSDQVVVGTSTFVKLPEESVVTIDSQTVTLSREANGNEVFDLGSDTITLSPGGVGRTVGSQMVSEASNGAVTLISATATAKPSSSALPHMSTTTTSAAGYGIKRSLQGLFAALGLVITNLVL